MWDSSARCWTNISCHGLVGMFVDGAEGKLTAASVMTKAALLEQMPISESWEMIFFTLETEDEVRRMIRDWGREEHTWKLSLTSRLLSRGDGSSVIRHGG